MIGAIPLYDDYQRSANSRRDSNDFIPTLETTFRRQIANCLHSYVRKGAQPTEAIMRDYENAYSLIYIGCVSIRNGEKEIYNLLVKVAFEHPLTEHKGGKYIIDRLARTAAYLNRFFVSIYELPRVEVAMKRAMHRSLAPALWRRLRSYALYVMNERDAKVQGGVDKWLLKNGLEDWIDSKKQRNVNSV